MGCCTPERHAALEALARATERHVRDGGKANEPMLAALFRLQAHDPPAQERAIEAARTAYVQALERYAEPDLAGAGQDKLYADCRRTRAMLQSLGGTL